MKKRIALAALAYLCPTFVLGFLWHLVAFKAQYDALRIYRSDVIIPFGLLAMSIQAASFAWIYERVFSRWPDAVRRVLGYAAFGAALSWSFTTVAIAAKNMMSSVPQYLFIESCFTVTQWLIVAPLTALVLRSTASLPQRAGA